MISEGSNNHTWQTCWLQESLWPPTGCLLFSCWPHSLPTWRPSSLLKGWPQLFKYAHYFTSFFVSNWKGHLRVRWGILLKEFQPRFVTTRSCKIEHILNPSKSLEELGKQSRINYTTVSQSPYFQYFKNMAGAEEELYLKWKELTLNSSGIDQVGNNLKSVGVTGVGFTLWACLEFELKALTFTPSFESFWRAKSAVWRKVVCGNIFFPFKYLIQSLNMKTDI